MCCFNVLGEFLFFCPELIGYRPQSFAAKHTSTLVSERAKSREFSARDVFPRTAFVSSFHEGNTRESIQRLTQANLITETKRQWVFRSIDIFLPVRMAFTGDSQVLTSVIIIGE